MKNIHIRLSLYSIITGILFSLAWHPIGLFPLVFVALVPLFHIHYEVDKNQLGPAWAFLYGYAAFLTFNLGTTWWVWNASAGGAIMAFILNSLLMNLPFMFLHNVAKRKNNFTNIWPFVWAWLAFEFFHYRWDGTWTWLSLGNVFANVPWLVQWYELTGVAGGTFWILWLNKSLFDLSIQYKQLAKPQLASKIFNILFFQLFAPVFLSFYVLGEYQKRQASMPKINARVMVVQPNIDPYRDKFEGMTPEQQTQKMLDIAERNIDSATQLVMFPETALLGGLEEHDLNSRNTVQQVRAFMKAHPNVSILTGADTHKIYEPGEKASATARKSKGGLTYDSYNTALFFKPNNDTLIDIYHKSKLVPGVERLPFSAVLKHLEVFAIDMGGTTGSLGVDDEAKTFSINSMFSAAPIICYESIFGQYVTEYVKRGANLLCIITNDGWWDNTPGYMQHNQYARLRAIETRRYVARSANTGISSFIDDEGKILNQTAWYKGEALTQDVRLNYTQTFYVKHGDVIYEIGVLLTIIALFSMYIKRKIFQFKPL